MKKFALPMITVIVLSAWGYNGWVYRSQTLEEPLPLRHHYETSADAVHSLDIYYITSVDSSTQLTGITFPGQPTLPSRQTMTVMKYGRFELKQSLLYVPESPAWNGLTDARPLVFDRALLRYNDGEEREADIGRIVVHPPEREGSPLSPYQGRASSDGSGSVSYEVEEAVTVLSVTHGLDESIGEAAVVGLTPIGPQDEDAGAALPLSLSAGDRLRLDYLLQWPEGDTPRYDAYKPRYAIELRTEDGNLYVESHEPSARLRLQERDLPEYVASRQREGTP